MHSSGLGCALVTGKLMAIFLMITLGWGYATAYATPSDPIPTSQCLYAKNWNFQCSENLVIL